MYFPRLYPDELLYSGIARCRVHLGIGNHKTLLHMLFGDSKVAAITDLPTHLTALANNTGLDAEGMPLSFRRSAVPIFFRPCLLPTGRRLVCLGPRRPWSSGPIGCVTARSALKIWLRATVNPTGGVAGRFKG